MENALNEEPVVCDLKSLRYSELERLMVDQYGEKRFRAQQVWQWLYKRFALSWDEMTNLSKSLRAKLSSATTVSALEHVGTFPSRDGTAKLTFRCKDGAIIETVYIPAEGRNTLCISSQVGCAMGCTFCFTAKMGLKRQLSTAEIVDQVVHARRLFGQENGHIGNIVFMGMGEPLHNYDNVVSAIEILMDERGLDFSKRKITVSTSGLVPQIKKFAQDTDVQLAISLNGTTDLQRSQIMPINDRYNLAELMSTLREIPLKSRQRITFEYVLLKGVNDTLEDAQRIIDLTAGIPAKINIIPFNPHPGTPFERPSEADIDRFQQYMVERHVTCMRRRTRGDEKMAACGQLGKPGEKEPRHLRRKLEPFLEQQVNRETSSNPS